MGDVSVWIDSTSSIQKLHKGEDRPLFTEVERMSALDACPWVTGGIGRFNGPGAAKAIRAVKPSMWVKGGDYLRKPLREDELAALEEVGAALCIAPRFEGLSTTEIVERIRGNDTG
ncbi:hypothetical protein LCGC14_1746230 [marine sediment metagenome]|uniref:Cytidyltransferase-like domain-containing protein n=1 Tax=marine sediment metagenome TaxID=412755 RepID=A0A0F9JKE2_9ZZZZ